MSLGASNKTWGEQIEVPQDRTSWAPEALPACCNFGFLVVGNRNHIRLSAAELRQVEYLSSRGPTGVRLATTAGKAQLPEKTKSRARGEVQVIDSALFIHQHCCLCSLQLT